MSAGPKYRYYVLVMLTVVSIFNIADRLVISILLEDIKAEFGFSDVQVGLLAGLAFTLFYAFMGIPIARLADKTNRKNIISAALVIWSSMMALCGAATGFVSFFLARLGVGIGEAGGAPPSYSIIADYFKPHEQTRAMGIYITGAVIGAAGGLMLGGYLADMLGWRMTLVAMGIPGIVFGLILFLTIREPERGRYDKKGIDSGKDAKLSKTLRSLAGNQLYIRISLAWGLINVIGYAIAIWLAPIMIRNFDVSLTKVGFYLGLGFLIGGIPGPIIGGYITDRLAKYNQRWYAWFGAIMVILAVAFYALTLTATTFTVFISFFVLGYFFFMLPQGTSLSIMQTSLKSGEKALGVAFALFANNVLGMALGPFLVGLMSDNFNAEYGVKSLNYSVLILCVGVGILTCLMYLWTAVAMKNGPAEITEK